MLWGMLWILGAYGAAIAILHLAHAACKPRPNNPKAITYALVTHNNEAQIEWFLRSLTFVSRLKGKPITIVVFDDYSTDGTLPVARKIADERNGVEIRLLHEGDLEPYLMEHADQATVVCRLDSLGNKKGLPVLQI
ncbi:MAG: hypothetical protein K0R57_4327 [Paenibacillaceae bacterium]|jgi:hypothetical protein|nr:hypothetical protein [Paenibacillaceae bacterium]